MAQTPVPTPTNNEVPSTDIRDVVFAGAKMDEVMTSTNPNYTDRKGVVHKTWAGIEADSAEKIAEIDAESAEKFSEVDKIIGSLDTANFTFPDIASGLAQTSNGQYFRKINGSGNDIAFDYFRNINGVAIPITSIASAAAIEKVLNTFRNVSDDTIFQFMDSLGFRQFYALINGEFGNRLAKVKPDGLELEGYSLVVSDAEGITVQNILGQGVTLVSRDGVVAPRSIRAAEDGSFGSESERVSPGGVSFDNGNTRFDVSGPEFLKVTDFLGRSKTIIDAQGNLVGQSGAGITLADRINILNNQNLNYYSKVRSRYPAGIERMIFALTIILGTGQSLETSQEGWPALSSLVKAMLGNLMLGDSIRPNSRTAPEFVPVGEAVLKPLKAVTQTTSGASVITPAAEAALAAGSPNEGEGAVGAINMLRTLFLNHMALEADPSRLLVLASCGVNGRTIEALSKGATPELYNRVREAVTKIKAIANTQGKSCGIGAILFDQGQWNYNPTYGGDGTREGWKALFRTYYNDIVNDFCSTQRPPAVFMSQTGASYSNDVNELDIGMAQLDLVTGGGNFFGTGPTYQYPDKGGHLTSNSYRWRSMQDAKVMFRALVLGEGWEPLHCTSAKVTGDYALLNYAVPYPPLQWGTPYVGRVAITYTDRGYRATDSNGTLPIAAVEIVADTVVKITFARAAIGTVKIWYADKTSHNGNGCLKDSDPFLATENYVYTAGSGQYADENIPDLVDKPYSLNNWAWAQVITTTVTQEA